MATKPRFIVDDLRECIIARYRLPELASIFAAASIIPHSVNHPSSEKMTAISQRFFHRLAFSANYGVRGTAAL